MGREGCNNFPEVDWKWPRDRCSAATRLNHMCVCAVLNDIYMYVYIYYNIILIHIYMYEKPVISWNPRDFCVFPVPSKILVSRGSKSAR